MLMLLHRFWLPPPVVLLYLDIFQLFIYPYSDVDKSPKQLGRMKPASSAGFKGPVKRSGWFRGVNAKEPNGPAP